MYAICYVEKGLLNGGGGGVVKKIFEKIKYILHLAFSEMGLNFCSVKSPPPIFELLNMHTWANKSADSQQWHLTG